ncbi:MAG: hypothetical protein OXE44_16685 [Nitrospinae bacterium]|nr:hypothetical protein [Nitrospinota bacterium]
MADFTKLPEHWPTHRMSREFWEELGRTVATFGFLEEILGKAIFALSATRGHKQITDEMYERWLIKLKKALKEPLGSLIGLYESELDEEIERESEISKQIDLRKLIKDLREAKVHRDVLCHGSWRPGSSSGKAKPFFVNKKDEMFDSEYDVGDFQQIRLFVTQTICVCISTVTLKRIQFPGSNGPGQPI